MNQIYGYQILPGDRDPATIVFEGASPVDIPSMPRDVPRQVRLFATPNTSLQAYVCQRTRRLVYVWGVPVHPDIPQSEIPAWCLDVVAKRRYGQLKDLLGHFVIIIDDPRQRCVTFVTDIVGVRHMFVGHSTDRLVFGSEVWPIQRAGLIKGEVNYDAVSAWLAYRYNCTNSSLFNELYRVHPGSVMFFQNGYFKTVPYVQWESRDDHATEEQTADTIHQIMSDTIKTILAQIPRFNLALSGGYDSRYLLALATSLGKHPVECLTVATHNQQAIAHQVAERFEASHREIPVRGSEWNLYNENEVFHDAPDGFPITKNLTYSVAQESSRIPLLTGFIGGSLVRGANDTYLGKFETEWKENLVEVLHRKHGISFSHLRKDLAKRLRERSRDPMEEAVRQGSRIGKILGWTDIYYRQRFYIANNFLQHLGFTEAVTPFYNWPLFNYKMSHPYGTCTRNVYEMIFRKFFPKVATLPHADFARSRSHQPRIAVCARTWAKQLLQKLGDKGRLTLLSRGHCIPRFIAGAGGVRRVEPLVLEGQRLYLFEKHLEDAGLHFDWERI